MKDNDLIVGFLQMFIAACIVGTLIIFVNFLDGTACKDKAAIHGFEFKHGILIGCMVMPHKGKWIDLDSYRVHENYENE